jgi:hypothetical protein
VDLRRLRAGEWLAAAGGVALIVSLFMDWDGGPGAVVGVLLAAAAVLAFLLGVLQATQTSPAKPVAAGVLTAVFGPIAVLLVLLNLRGGGALLAVAATVAITAGAWLSIGNEHVRGLPPGPEPELRPSPGLGVSSRPDSELPAES